MGMEKRKGGGDWGTGGLGLGLGREGVGQIEWTGAHASPKSVVVCTCSVRFLCTRQSVIPNPIRWPLHPPHPPFSISLLHFFFSCTNETYKLKNDKRNKNKRGT